jgi:hypothetical protein
MFISVKQLRGDMDVDEEIARFFVNRKVPSGNVFWQNRLVYMPRGNGYLSIPVYYDLLYRIGIPKASLLSESHILLMEQIMHYAIQVEYGQISFADQLEELEKLLEGRIKNPEFFKELIAYLKQPVLKPSGTLGMQVPALNRADVFLFILCDLSLQVLDIQRAVRLWYALHTTYLLMDDIYDYHLDKQDFEENAIIELGDGKEGSIKAFDILNSNVELLHDVNPILSDYFYSAFQDLKKLSP